MKSSHPLFGVVLILAYAVCSALSYLLLKYAFIIDTTMSPINAVFWGFLGATILVGTFIGAQPQKRKQIQSEWNAHKKLIITISLITALGEILWAWSLQLATAGTVGLIGRADVLMTFVIGSIFLGERFSWKEIMGAIIAIGGLSFIVNLPKEISLFAVGVVLFMRFLYVMQSFFVKKSGQTLKGIPFTFCRMAIITMVLFITAFVSGHLSFPPGIILVFLVGSLLCGEYIGRAFYFESHKYLGIGHINLLILAQPVLLLVGTWLLLNEPMPLQKIIGGGILIAGLALIIREKGKLEKKEFSLKRIFATLRSGKNDTKNPVDFG